jgi:hypothetical protein
MSTDYRPNPRAYVEREDYMNMWYLLSLIAYMVVIVVEKSALPLLH